MSYDEDERLKLMVVDDEPDNLDLLYRTFRREFQVYKAENGFQALDVLEREGEMAIIISDQRMPKMNGTEFLSRTVERFPDTIRIVLTGYTDVEDLVEAINSGKVFKYITKPWNPDRLKEVVVQAAETYKVLKQRTKVLRRALKRESLVNEIITAVRESLDYQSTLQTVVETLGRTFSATYAVLRPVDWEQNGVGTVSQLSPDAFRYLSPESEASGLIPSEDSDSSGVLTQVLESQESTGGSRANLFCLDQADNPTVILTIPLVYQQACLAIVALYHVGEKQIWSEDTIELAESIAEQVALAISQAKLYQRIQLQTQQMRAELEVARQIQTNLLRQSWPDIESIRIQSHCLPAREVGGDFFEVFVHPQGDVWLAVGDVSGKGVPAALFMASAISVLRRELSQELPPEPDQVMQNLNSSLVDDLVSNNCFITMVLVRYTPKTGRLVYANAGHVYPLVWPHSTVATAIDAEIADPQYLDVRGVPLGILPVWKANPGEQQLTTGDALLLISDGITEATVTDTSQPNSGEMLNQSGLWQLLKQQPYPLELDKLLAQIQGFDTRQDDDQTMLSLEVL